MFLKRKIAKIFSLTYTEIFMDEEIETQMVTQNVRINLSKVSLSCHSRRQDKKRTV